MDCKKIKLAIISALINVCVMTTWIAGAETSQTVDQHKTPTTSVEQPQQVQQSEEPKETFSGNASWYGIHFQGEKTASGEIFDMNKLSGAHRQLPLPTKVLVENPRNGKSAVVRINDRGPHNLTRILDLSRAAALRTGIFEHGVGYVECTVLNSK
jgi:rare lipoprotein A (peptidoglycan hydrolase)